MAYLFTKNRSESILASIIIDVVLKLTLVTNNKIFDK